MSAFDFRTDPPRVAAPRQRALTRADLAGQFESLMGRRVVLVNGDGSWFDYRAVSEVTMRKSGFGAEAVSHPFVAVMPEAAWYGQSTAATVESMWWPAGAVWVEARA